MRSGRGKCPQCKETIVVDLDAEEIRCPFCNALLKKSAKSPAEVRAEQEREKAEKEAVAAAAAADIAVAEEPVPDATEPAPVAEEPAPVAEDTAVGESVSEPEAIAEEPAAEEPVDEIGISDEELAMMDETPADEIAETPAAETEAPAEEVVDEIGISDEELAMMDEAPAPATETAEESEPEEIPVEGAFTDEAPAAAPAAEEDEPLVFGSIGADADDATPEEADAARIAAEENEADIPEEDAAPVNNNISLEDDVDPALLDEDLSAITDAADETPAETPAPAEEPASAPASEPAPDLDPAFDVASDPAFDSVAEPVAEPAETPAPIEEPAAETAPEEIPEEIPAETPAEVAEETPAEEAVQDLGYTDEDMAFAASLSEPSNRSGKVGFVPVGNIDNRDNKKEKTKQKPKEKKAASEGEKSMKGSSVYKKPIAVLMLILSILAAAVWFLYYKASVLLLIPADVVSVLAKLPVVESSYVVAAFAGLIALVSLLGLTGKKGSIGFLFVLLADVVFALVTLFGTTPIVEVEAIQKIVIDYGKYAVYAIYGLMFLAAIFFAISFGRGRNEYDFSVGGAILPILYMAVVVVGYIVLILMPKFSEGFVFSADMERYAILGAIGVALLMTIVGVHNASTSRAVNGWFVFATLLSLALINFVPIVVEKFLTSGEAAEEAAVAMYTYPEIPYFLTPIIAIFGVAGFAAADLRN